MTNGHVYELADATYPLVPEAATRIVSVGEEIRCLLDAGWTWDGDKLVHPTQKGSWVLYKRTDASRDIIARSDQFNLNSSRPCERQDGSNGRRKAANHEHGDDQEIDIAVRSHLAACGRTEQDDLVGLRGRDNALNTVARTSGPGVHLCAGVVWSSCQVLDPIVAPGRF